MELATTKRASSRPSDRPRSKSGCATCRKRKVKCDESYPVCHRCVSTGRVCDGYGVWGGGGGRGNLHGPYHRRGGRGVAAITSPQLLHIPLLVATAVEKEHFDWFRHYTLTKLPGSFNSDFWGALLPQACLSDRAVFNAVLALSSVHRGGYHTTRKPGSLKAPKEAEIFTLEHYLQAITHLQPCFSCRDKASFRITLIVCIVFVSIEFLRGNFISAQNHVRSGLKLLAGMEQLSHNIENGRVSRANVSSATLLKAATGNSTDYWTMEVLSRLYIQINLCQPFSCHSYTVPFLIPPPLPQQQKFGSHRFAWLELDRQLHRVFYLSAQARQHKKDAVSPSPVPSGMVRLQASVLVDLEHWLKILKASEESLFGNQSIEYRKAYCILAMYHTMVTIMAHTCMSPEDESVFDAFTDHFLIVIEQATALCSIPGGSLDKTAPPSDPISFDTSRSIIDVGCLPQLYYTALKCRVHCVRHKAVELLQPMVHREGFWDARIAATVARRVVEVEEGAYYTSFEMASCGSHQDALPVLPACYRLRDVEVVYSGEPFNKVLLFCKRGQNGDNTRRVCIGQYEVNSQTWVDVPEE